MHSGIFIQFLECGLKTYNLHAPPPPPEKCILLFASSLVFAWCKAAFLMNLWWWTLLQFSLLKYQLKSGELLNFLPFLGPLAILFFKLMYYLVNIRTSWVQCPKISPSSNHTTFFSKSCFCILPFPAIWILLLKDDGGGKKREIMTFPQCNLLSEIQDCYDSRGKKVETLWNACNKQICGKVLTLIITQSNSNRKILITDRWL